MPGLLLDSPSDLSNLPSSCFPSPLHHRCFPNKLGFLLLPPSELPYPAGGSFIIPDHDGDDDDEEEEAEERSDPRSGRDLLSELHLRDLYLSAFSSSAALLQSSPRSRIAAHPSAAAMASSPPPPPPPPSSSSPSSSCGGRRFGAMSSAMAASDWRGDGSDAAWEDAIASLQKFLPSNREQEFQEEEAEEAASSSSSSSSSYSSPSSSSSSPSPSSSASSSSSCSSSASIAMAMADSYSSDDFRMYEFKVRRCPRGRSHDWTECPFAHPGEKARRRDPRRFHYSGASCPDFRKGLCKRGDSCELSHGVFECWLHPARYRTQPCKDGENCCRKICFFAHSPQQLRVLPSPSSASSIAIASVAEASMADSVSSSPSSSSSSSSARSSVRRENLRFLDESSPPSSPVLQQPWRPPATIADLCSPRLQQLESSSRCSADLFNPNPNPNSFPLHRPPMKLLLQKLIDDSACHGSSPTSPLSPSSSSSSSSSSSLPSSASSSPFSPDSSSVFCPNPRSFSHLSSHSSSPLSASPATSPSLRFDLESAHRRHLHRLQYAPTIAVPAESCHANLHDLPSAMTSPSYSVASPTSPYLHSRNELASYLQSLQVRESQAMAGMVKAASDFAPHHSPYRLYRRISGDQQPQESLFNALGSVESGRDLRASFYGKIGKENGVKGNGEVDLGWVSDLVQ